MIILTSPAKTQNFSTKWDEELVSQPYFLKITDKLAKSLGELSVKKLAQTLKISDKLAELNYARYKAWQPNNDTDQIKPAILVFKGDVYKQLTPEDYTQSEKKYAQESLRIISGLYGLLKPYDLIQAYRLEMKLKDEFWRSKITEALNQGISQDGHDLVINLASNEYTNAVDLVALNTKFMTVGFRQKRNGETKNIGLFAKRMRGEMIQYCIKNQINSLEGVKKFSGNGYKLYEETNNELVFLCNA